MRKSILWCVLILVVLTLGAGAIVAMEIKTGPLVYFAHPLLWLGCLAGWMMKGDNFANEHEFLRFGFAMSVPINAILGVLLGAIIALARARFGRLRRLRTATRRLD